MTYTCYDVSFTAYDKPLDTVDKRKYKKYMERCKAANLKFVPLAVNPLDHMSPLFVDLIHQIGEQKSIRREEVDSNSEAHLTFASIQFVILLT